MTDLERFVELYRSFGIELIPKRTDDGGYEIQLTAKSHPKLEGYNGFFSDIYFDAQGRFIKQGFWE